MLISENPDRPSESDFKVIDIVSELASSAIYDASIETAKNIAVWHSPNGETTNGMIKVGLQIAGIEWAKFNHELCLRLGSIDNETKNYIEHVLKAMKKHKLD